MYAIFIDFKYSYDSIDRTVVYIDMGLPTELTRMARITLEQTMNNVMTGARVSTSFGTRTGLRQGDPISTVPFKRALERVMPDENINRMDLITNKGNQCTNTQTILQKSNGMGRERMGLKIEGHDITHSVGKTERESGRRYYLQSPK